MPGIMYVTSMTLDMLDDPRQRSRARAYAPAAAAHTPIAVATTEIRIVFLYQSPNWVSPNNLPNCCSVHGWGHMTDVMSVIWLEVLKADTKAKKNGNNSNRSSTARTSRLSPTVTRWPAFLPASDSSAPRPSRWPMPRESAAPIASPASNRSVKNILNGQAMSRATRDCIDCPSPDSARVPACMYDARNQMATAKAGSMMMAIAVPEPQ